jgi:hypothetical protein
MKISLRFKAKPIDAHEIVYQVYGRSKGKKGFRFLYSAKTLEQARSMFSEVYERYSTTWFAIENDYIIKETETLYRQKTIDVAPMRKLKTKLPELKGII